MEHVLSLDVVVPNCEVTSQRVDAEQRFDTFQQHEVIWHEDRAQSCTDLCFHIANGVARLNIESDAVAYESLNEDFASLNLKCAAMED